MDRRDFVRVAGTAALGTLVGCGGEGRGDGASGGTAAPLTADQARAAGWSGYDRATVIDALGGPIQFNIPQEGLPLRPEALAAVRESGITAVNLTANARPTETATAFEATNEKMAAWSAEIEAHPDVLRLVTNGADIRAAKEEGQLGIILGFQDGVPFEDDLGRLDAYYAEGLRIVQLTYNVENRLGSGSLAPSDSGLTDFGREAVARMDELGILVDLSHCGPRTTLDGILASSRPVSITHSGCSALYRHPRSKDDETLRALAERGGVVGIYLMPFLNESGPPTAEDVILHIEHAVNVCGEDHVGIGTDQGIVPLDVSGDFPERFDAVSAQRAAAGIAAPREDTIPYVPDLNHPRRMATIAAMLDSRGHSASVIEKVLGTNFVRLFEEVWE
jgi:membrane dipeptidase